MKIFKSIKLVLFDVDGVLTDGAIYISEQGESLKAFNVQDGLAIELLLHPGIYTGVVSGKAVQPWNFVVSSDVLMFLLQVVKISSLKLKRYVNKKVLILVMSLFAVTISWIYL